MKSSSIQFKIKSTYIQTNDERFVKKSLKRYVAEKGVLLNLVSLAGIVPAISAYIKNPIPLTWDVSVFYPVPIGFIFWLIIVSLGYRGAAQYGLE
jgi:hypothetical protein